MTRTKRFILGVLAAAAFAAPTAAQAGGPKTISCSANVQYLLNNTLRNSYTRDFTVAPGVPFSEDLSNAIRFKFIDAVATLDADGKSTNVRFVYYADVSAIESADFSTELKVPGDKKPVTTSADSTYWSSFGVAGLHTTKWSLTCVTLDD